MLDDYHVLTEPAVHRSLSYLLEHQPPQLHVVIATRSDPPLPLGRLRAAGGLLEIRAADLGFTDEEANRLLNDSLQLGLPEDHLARLGRRTEGWAAGLYLAGLSLRRRSDRAEFIEEFTGTDRYVLDYLGAEVPATFPAERRDFLLETSILPRMTAQLCQAVTGRADSAGWLERIERANLFLVPLDEGREWYRYHHLFVELLRHELALTAPQRVPELHRRAAAWFGARGELTAAIDPTVAAGDLDAAAELAADDQDLTVRRDVAVVRAVHRFKVGDVGASHAAARRVLELNRGEVCFAATVAHCLLGATLLWRGDPALAIRPLVEAVQLARRTDPTRRRQARHPNGRCPRRPSGWSSGHWRPCRSGSARWWCSGTWRAGRPTRSAPRWACPPATSGSCCTGPAGDSASCSRRSSTRTIAERPSGNRVIRCSRQRGAVPSWLHADETTPCRWRAALDAAGRLRIGATLRAGGRACRRPGAGSPTRRAGGAGRSGGRGGGGRPADPSRRGGAA